MPSACDVLTTAFRNWLGVARQARRNGTPVALLSSPDVPVELVRAAGFHAAVLRGLDHDTAQADRVLEPGVFEPRIKTLIELLLTQALSFVDLILLPRTSEQDYKCFLYARELARTGEIRTGAPRIVLFDWLRSASAGAERYRRGRLTALTADLAGMAGRTITGDDIHRESASTHEARAAARRLAGLRRPVPLVSGAESLPLFGAFWDLPPAEYRQAADAAALELSSRPPIDSPRIILAGLPVDGTALHTHIESHGCVVVAEAGHWGSGIGRTDVATSADPIDALHAHYASTHGARQPVADARASFEELLDEGVDGVVFWLPTFDSTAGWDYPQLRDRLRARRIPHLVLRERTAGQMDEQLAAFVQEAHRAHEGAARV